MSKAIGYQGIPRRPAGGRRVNNMVVTMADAIVEGNLRDVAGAGEMVPLDAAVRAESMKYCPVAVRVAEAIRDNPSHAAQQAFFEILAGGMEPEAAWRHLWNAIIAEDPRRGEAGPYNVLSRHH